MHQSSYKLLLWLLGGLIVFSGFSGSQPAADTSEMRVSRDTRESDSLALVAFFEATEDNYPGWKRKAGWLESELDAWYGVTVEEGRVTRLELPDNGIGGQLPSTVLKDLDQLKVLNLRGNTLYGDVPAGIIQLINLEELWIGLNSFHELPEGMENLTKLKILDLEGLDTWAPDLNFLSQLLKLEEAYLQGNSFDSLPDLRELKRAGVLRILDVSGNRLTFEDLEPNVGLFEIFLYTKQQSLFREITGFEDEPVVLDWAIGGQFNQYQWYRDGKAVGEPTDRYVIESMRWEDTGRYELEITNRRVARLTVKAIYEVSFDSRKRLKWLDIGSYHHVYDAQGAQREPTLGMEYPAILRNAGHLRARQFWVGVKDWVDPAGEAHEYKVTTMGWPTRFRQDIAVIEHKLIGRYEDPVVEVDGQLSFDKEAELDAVDASLPSDRMVHTVFNLPIGLTVERKAYAFTNEFHDNYHIIAYNYCNTGNIDTDTDIELPDQTLHGVYFYRYHRWRGNEQGAWISGGGQPWGKYTMHDVVGDGHQDYPVDFTAQYAWAGLNPQFAENNPGFSSLGSPMIGSQAMLLPEDRPDLIAPGDTLGRLADPSMVGRATLHADRSTSDQSYDRGQPSTMAWIESDWAGLYEGGPDSDFYKLYMEGEYLFVEPRAYPHYADLIEPGGEFWMPSADPSRDRQGGYSPSTAYGPYEMAPEECVTVVVSEGVAGLSFDAAVKIGQAYKQSTDRENQQISYDANGDGQINAVPFDYDQVFVGTELQTKNQWIMSARDSLFQTFNRATDLYGSSNRLSTYPGMEPPRPPSRFSVRGLGDGISLSWEPAGDGPDIEGWVLYRTDKWVDNLYANGCLGNDNIKCGYERIADLSVHERTYLDEDVVPGVDYFYYLQAVGMSQQIDPAAINGTPGGVRLKSGRYLTQTYDPVQLSSGIDEPVIPATLSLSGNAPNPFSDQTFIRYDLPFSADVNLSVYDLLGRRVAVLVDRNQLAGQYEVTLDADGLASGVYVYRLEVDERRESRKMLVVK